MKLFFGTLSNDYLTRKRVLLTSPFASETGVMVIENCPTATSGWNYLLKQAEEKEFDVAVLCHQDVYFPRGWTEKFLAGIGSLPDSWLIAGFYGLDKMGKHCGKIRDRRMTKMLSTTHELPREAMNVDGCAFAVRLKQGFLFEPLKGFDTYDIYAGLRAREMGRTVWIIDAPPEHFATRLFTWKPDEIFLENIKWLKGRFPNTEIGSTCYHE